MSLGMRCLTHKLSCLTFSAVEACLLLGLAVVASFWGPTWSEAPIAVLQGLMETYNLYRQHLLDSLPGYTDEAGQGMPLDSKAASRSNSAISKEAAEDLVRNGIFVSWGQLLWAILILACTIATARLALDGSMQAMARGSWRRKLQHASAMLQD